MWDISSSCCVTSQMLPGLTDRLRGDEETRYCCPTLASWVDASASHCCLASQPLRTWQACRQAIVARREGLSARISPAQTRAQAPVVALRLDQEGRRSCFDSKTPRPKRNSNKIMPVQFHEEMVRRFYLQNKENWISSLLLAKCSHQKGALGWFCSFAHWWSPTRWFRNYTHHTSVSGTVHWSTREPCIPFK